MKSFLWLFWQRRKRIMLFTIAAVLVFLFGSYIVWQWFVGALPRYPNSTVSGKCPDDTLSVFNDRASWFITFHQCYKSSDDLDKIRNWYNNIGWSGNAVRDDGWGNVTLFDIKIINNQILVQRRVLYGGVEINGNRGDFNIEARYVLYFPSCRPTTWLWPPEYYEQPVLDGLIFLSRFCFSQYQ